MTPTMPLYDWEQDGVFHDADGVPVHAYDDVALLRDLPKENDPEAQYIVPAGKRATVLFFQTERDGWAELDADWPLGVSRIIHEQTRFLRRVEKPKVSLEGSVG